MKVILFIVTFAFALLNVLMFAGVLEYKGDLSVGVLYATLFTVAIVCLGILIGWTHLKLGQVAKAKIVVKVGETVKIVAISTVDKSDVVIIRFPYENEGASFLMNLGNHDYNGKLVAGHKYTWNGTCLVSVID